MAATPEPIARIRLIRSWPRLLAVPAALGIVGIGWAAGAILLIGGVGGVLVAVLAVLPAAAAVLLAARVATMAVEVAEASVHVRWLGGARHYELVPGPVTRVRLRGEEASSLRARTRLLGWQQGEARLRDEEEIEVVRLAPTRTAILVPTDRGRLAIAAASEPELLDALSRAARAREQRAEEAPEPEEQAEDAEELDAAADEEEEPPHVLTGIERAMLDERLARELQERMEAQRIEAERVEAERLAALEAERVAEERARAEAEAREEAARRPPTLRDRLPSAGLLLLPLVATVAVWGIGLAMDRLPDAGSDQGRITALALVLAGPASSVGAIMARTWWPRLVGVVVGGGLASTVLIGRAVLGA